MQELIVICQKCHNHRSTDLKTPCSSCGASRTIFGYLYQHEFRAAFQATVAILTVVFLAILIGIGFLVYQWYLMGNGPSSFEVGHLVFRQFLLLTLFGGRV